MDNASKIIGILEKSIDNVRGGLEPGLFVSALLASLAAAFAASLLYRFFYERRGTGSQVHRAFPLLALSVTTLFIGVQISIPLSLGLLGSLSIIRFRTPIKEPEEVGFIMLVIASSICAATFNFSFIAILYIGAIASLLIMRGAALSRWLKRDGMVILSLPSAEAREKHAAIEEILRGEVSSLTLECSSSRDGTSTCQYLFSGMKCPPMELEAKLSEKASFSSINIYLDRPGGIR